MGTLKACRLSRRAFLRMANPKSLHFCCMFGHNFFISALYDKNIESHKANDKQSLKGMEQ